MVINLMNNATAAEKLSKPWKKLKMVKSAAVQHLVDRSRQRVLTKFCSNQAKVSWRLREGDWSILIAVKKDLTTKGKRVHVVMAFRRYVGLNCRPATFRAAARHPDAQVVVNERVAMRTRMQSRSAGAKDAAASGSDKF
ncbi:hypothetical protein ACXPWS_07110 [Mycobacterium sp. BMJ-28]